MNSITQKTVRLLKKNAKARLLVFGAIAVLVLLAVIPILLSGNKDKDAPPEIITTSTLKEIINISELSTYEVVYKGIATVMNEKKKENIDYYVSYDANIKAGFDIEKVEIDVNSEEKKVTVYMPEIKINDISVDITSLDFLFYNDKANSSTVSEEAYKACKEDAEKESGEQKAIYTCAEESADNFIEGLLLPFITQHNGEYSLEIVRGGK